MAERAIAPVCRTGALWLRGFESLPQHSFSESLPALKMTALERTALQLDLAYEEELAQHRRALVAAAVECIGWPYRFHDHSPNEKPYSHGIQAERYRGTDCSGFVRSVYFAACGVNFTPLHTAGLLTALGERARLVVPQAGDIVFARFHCGIADGHGRIIHASASHCAVVMEDLIGFLANRPPLRQPGVYYLVGSVPDILALPVARR